MMRVKALVLGLLLALGASGAWAQTGCQGQPAAGGTCGNPAATAGLPSWATMTALLDRNFGGPSTQGTVLNRGASVWSATATPTLGLNGGTGGSLTLNGATSGSALISVQAAAGTGTLFQLPNTNGVNGQQLITDGSGHLSWTSAGAGTVTSVGLALPVAIFTISGSPVTNTGTLTGTLATQSANTVWAGPTTGAASAPTFRALVGADLPNPSASTLGGVQSFAAVGSQWIRQISTSGVPTASQPAFTDISGSVAAAQLPNPSASTLGGVESLAAVASKWINTISTSGVPSATQPLFSDISGNATLAQLPSIGNGTLVSNISGGTTTPLANSLTSIIDTIIGATQGQVLYRSGTVWTALNPGTAGQVLTTGGAAANPSWTSVGGTGTVTNVATNNGVTGGPITTTGTIGLASISTGNVLANVSGISAAPSATTPTSVLDVIGATQGDILYRGASVWTALTPGTAGQYLQTGGAGSTPAWATSISALTALPTSGTSARTMAAHLQDYLNVRDFGAVGDGSTSDQTAFQAAIDASCPGHLSVTPPAAAVNQIFPIIVPASSGAYIVTQLNATNCAGFTMWGLGSGNRPVIKYTVASPANSIMDLTGSAAGISLKNLLFQGPQSDGISATYPVYGLIVASTTAGGANYNEIDNVGVSGRFQQAGMYIYGVCCSLVTMSSFNNFNQNNTNSYALVLTTSNVLTAGSSFTTINTSSAAGMSDWTFDRTEAHAFLGGGGASPQSVFFDSAININWTGGQIGACQTFLMRTNGTNANINFRGTTFYCDNGTSASVLFGAASGTLSHLVLENVFIRLTTAGTLFSGQSFTSGMMIESSYQINASTTQIHMAGLGTSPSASVGSVTGTDLDGTVTTSGTQTGTIITFATPFNGTPSCNANALAGNVLTIVRSTTSLVITWPSASGVVVDWHCMDKVT
jgi:hypothetical protein